MINIHVKELTKEFDSKIVNVARVNTEDGRTFSLSVSMKISQDSTKQNWKSGASVNSNITRSPIECDTSGCMNSSPDSERSGILNQPEFVDNVACDVDDFLNSFNDPTFRLESQSTVDNLTEGITDEAECESIADSDCNTSGIEYFVVDELVGKRFNDKTQKYEFLLRPKRYIPKNEIIWNPIDNLDNFDISLLEHNRLYIEVPDSLKKQEKRKKSVLQDKFLSEVNLPSGKKIDYLPSSAGDLRNVSFEKMYPNYMCSGNVDNTLDVEMGNISANFEELVPVVPVLIDSGHQTQTTDSSEFPELELKKKKRRQARQRAKKMMHMYYCADCDFSVNLKRKMMQHVRTHLPQYSKTNNSRGTQRKKIQDTHDPKRPKRFCRSKTKFTEKSSNSEEHSPAKSKPAKRRKLNSTGNAVTVANMENSNEIEDTVNENCPDIAMGVMLEQELKNVENCTLPETQLNLTNEISQETSYSPETKFKRIRGCVRVGVKHVQKEKNELVGNRRKSKRLLEFHQPVNGALNMRQTRKRSGLQIESEETESALNDRESNEVSKFADGGLVQLETGIPNECPEEPSNPESNYENGDNSLQLPESRTPILLPKETEPEVKRKPSNCISIPVIIPLSVLENAGIDVEMLRRKFRKKIEKENSIVDENLPSSISVAFENASSSAGVDCTNVNLTLPSHAKVPTEVFRSENTATDEEVIFSTINRILDILDAECCEKSKDTVDEKNPIELNERSQNPWIEKDSVESAETFEGASVEANVAIESQEPKLLSVFNKVENTKKKDSSSNSVPDDVRRRKCTFCEFVAVGYSKYKEHIIKSHADKFRRCFFCTKSLMSESSMQRHQRENHAEYLPVVLLSRIIHPDSSAC